MKIVKHIVALGACIPMVAANAAPAPAKTVVLTSGNCLITAQPGGGNGQAFIGAIAAIVLPVLIELGIEAVSAELKKVKTATSSGSLNFNLYETGADATFPNLLFPSCITVLTGDLGDVSSRSIKTVNTSQGGGGSEDAVRARLQANGVDLGAGAAYSVIELQVVQSDDRTAFWYKPVYAKVFRLMPGGGSAKRQGLVVNMSLSGPGASPNGSVYSLAPISFGTVSAGWSMTGADAGKLKSGYLVLPGMNDLSYRAYVQDVVNGKSGKAYMPVSLKAEVVQTQKPSDAAIFVASVLDKAKPKVVEAVGPAIAKLDPFAASQAKLDAQIAVASATADLTEANASGNAAKAALATLKLKKAQATLAEIGK